MHEITITKKELLEINAVLGYLYNYSVPVPEHLEERLSETYRRAQMVKAENKDFFLQEYRRLFSKRLPIQYSVGRNIDMQESEAKLTNSAKQKIADSLAEKNEDGSVKMLNGEPVFGDKKEEAEKMVEDLLAETVTISVYQIKESIVEDLPVEYMYLKPLIGKIIV